MHFGRNQQPFRPRNRWSSLESVHARLQRVRRRRHRRYHQKAFLSGRWRELIKGVSPLLPHTKTVKKRLCFRGDRREKRRLFPWRAQSLGHIGGGFNFVFQFLGIFTFKQITDEGSRRKHEPTTMTRWPLKGCELS